MTRVAIVTAATNTIPRYRMDMAKEFVRRGCEIIVLGDEDTAAWRDYFAAHNMRYRTYPICRNGTNPLQDLKTLRALQQIFEEECPSKVFTYQVKPNIYGIIAAYQAGISECYAMLGGLGTAFNGTTLKSKMIGEFVAREYRLAFKHVKRAFFQNMDDVNTFVERGILTRDKVAMVHGSGVNTEHFGVCPLPKDVAFVLVGRLVRGKGVMEFLDAARIVKSIHPQVRFNLVGPFDTNPTSLTPAQLAPYTSDGTVEYWGELEDVRPVLASSSVFVLPSYYGEGTPKSALEAMAMGRPVIMADAVGSREVVEHGKNGILVSPRDAVDVAAAMLMLIENPSLIDRMGACGRRMAEEVFDVRKVNAVICGAMGIQ